MYAISQLDTSTICIKNEHHQQAESSKEAAELNNTINQLNIIDIYGLPHPTAAKHTFFSSAHGKFTKIKHTWGHKTPLNKFKRIKIIQCLIADHNEIKLRMYTER